MNKSVLKKKLPEYMFYLREPIENVPQHMRRHVEKAKERWNERWRSFFVGKRVIDLDRYLNLDAVLQKPYLLGAVGPPHSWEVMLDILTWSGRRKVAEVYDHTSGQPRNEFRKKY